MEQSQQRSHSWIFLAAIVLICILTIVVNEKCNQSATPVNRVADTVHAIITYDQKKSQKEIRIQDSLLQIINGLQSKQQVIKNMSNEIHKKNSSLRNSYDSIYVDRPDF